MGAEFTKAAEEILAFLGDVKNILSVEKCSSRLKLKLIDKNVVNVSKFKEVDGVLGVVETREQLQIVISPKKSKGLINEFNKIYNIKK